MGCCTSKGNDAVALEAANKREDEEGDIIAEGDMHAEEPVDERVKDDAKDDEATPREATDDNKEKEKKEERIAEVIPRKAEAEAMEEPVQEKEGEETNDEIPRVGVSLQVLRSLLAKANALRQGMTTSEVCHEIVKPATEAVQCSFAQLIIDSGKDGVMDCTEQHVDTATVFVSHAWQCPFEELVGCVEAHATAVQQAGDTSRADFFWVDVVVNTQWITPKHDFRWWCQTFGQNIRSIGHTLVVLYPWSNPLPLTRAWCLFELLSTHTGGSKLSVRLSCSETQRFNARVFSSEAGLLELQKLSCIDVEKSQAFSQEDKASIFKAVQSLDGGFDLLNISVKKQIRGWLQDHCSGVLKEVLAEAASEETLGKLNLIGRILQQLARYQQAEQLFAKARAGCDALKLGDKHPLAMETRHNQGWCYMYQLRGSEACEVFKEVLQARKEVLGEEHEKTLDTWFRLTDGYVDQGMYAEAWAQLTPLLLSQNRLLGAKHPKTLMSRALQASLYRRQGDLEEAKEAYIAVVADSKEALGNVHYDTCIRCVMYALTLKKSGDFAGAEALYRRAIPLLTQNLGAEHPQTLTSTNNLATCLTAQNRLQEALDVMQKLLQVKKIALGANHPSALTSAFNLAVLYSRGERHEEGKPLFQFVADEREALYGAGDRRTLFALFNVARNHQHLQDYAAALPLFERCTKGLLALDTEDKNLDLTKRHINRSQGLAGVCLVELGGLCEEKGGGRAKEGKEMVARALQGMQELGPVQEDPAIGLVYKTLFSDPKYAQGLDTD